MGAAVALDREGHGLSSRFLHRLGQRGRAYGGLAVDGGDDVPHTDACVTGGVDVSRTAASRGYVHVAEAHHQDALGVELDPEGHSAHVDLAGRRVPRGRGGVRRRWLCGRCGKGSARDQQERGQQERPELFHFFIHIEILVF